MTNTSSTTTQVPKSAKKAKAKTVSKKKRAGTCLSPAFVAGRMRAAFPKGMHVAKGADVYLAAAMDRILFEVLEGSVKTAKADKVKRVQPRHISDALQADPELAAQIAGGGRGVIARGRKRGGDDANFAWSDKKKDSKNE